VRVKTVAVDIECMICETPLYEEVTALTEVPWGSVRVCDTCDNSVRLPPTPFSVPFRGTAAILGR
jgi:hypothetical protein